MANGDCWFPRLNEPESNDYVIEVRLVGIRKVDALALAEQIALVADHNFPRVGVAMTVAHVKYG